MKLHGGQLSLENHTLSHSLSYNAFENEEHLVGFTLLYRNKIPSLPENVEI